MTEAYRQVMPAEEKEKVSDSVTFYNLAIFFRDTKLEHVDQELKGRSLGIFDVIYQNRANVCEGRALEDMLGLIRTVETSIFGQEDTMEKLAVYLEGRIDQFSDNSVPLSGS